MSPSKLISDEQTLYTHLRDLVLAARTAVSRGVDLIQVQTNFEMGRYIVEFEQRGSERAEYGTALVKNIAHKLSLEFGAGFSETNLKLMKHFFSLYRDRTGLISQSLTGLSTFLPKISQPVTDLLGNTPNLTAPANPQAENTYIRPFCVSWTHYVCLLGIKNPAERSFYEIEAAAQSWTVRELKRQFDSSLYERLALSRDPDGIRQLAQQGQIVAKPADLLKEPLVLEFLGLSSHAQYSESDLEAAIISHVEHFLLELGKGFLFEARQKRFTFDGDHFFVDLVFYNRLLRCYVLVDLKLGKLSHQDLGQMQMYVNYFDRHVKAAHETPTVGIVLCKQHSRAMVEITLPTQSNIQASEYQLYLPSKETLQTKLDEWALEAGQ